MMETLLVGPIMIGLLVVFVWRVVPWLVPELRDAKRLEHHAWVDYVSTLPEAPPELLADQRAARLYSACQKREYAFEATYAGAASVQLYSVPGMPGVCLATQRTWADAGRRINV